MVYRADPTRQALPSVLLVGAGLLCACPPPNAFEGPLGGIEVALDAPSARLEARREGRALLAVDLREVGFRAQEASFEMQFGMFRIEEEDAPAWETADQVELVEAGPEGPVRFRLLLKGNPIAEGMLEARGEGHLRLELRSADPAYNRVVLPIGCEAGDHFAGLGAQTHDVDHRGQVVPLWVSEQGIGKLDTDDYPTLWQVVGRRHTTHVPIPAVVTSRGTALLVETFAFSRFDLCAIDARQARLEVWEGALVFHVFDGPNPLQALSRMTELVGRPRVPPPWAFAPWNDAIFGSESVRAFARFLRENEIPSSAIWSEDWRGGAWYGDMYRLDEDWGLDRELYPDYEALAAELRGMGIAPQVYFNTFLTEGGDVFDEAVEQGYAIGSAAGGPYLFDGPDASFSPTALVDLTSEKARAWVKGHLSGALALGALGWMADYAEWMPVEGAKLASGEDPRLVHNRYPVMWAELNDEVVRDEGREDEVIIFLRSGHLGSQRHAQVLWAGDQRTSFDADDGLPTVIPIGLGLAATGFPFYAHDVAGYQSSTNPPATKELFFRWTELGAFTPVMRTHHGTHAGLNWNLQSDEESTAHWKRYAEIHIRLYPYLRALAHRAHEEGIPLWIPLGLAFPDDEALWPILDQYLFGEALLVAPVVTEGATEREVRFPEGRWAPFLVEGEAVVGPTTKMVPAPLEEIPVFLRAGGIVPLTAEPAQTLFEGVEGVPGLETVEGDRHVFVGLGKGGRFVEESGARYILDGEGTSLAGLLLEEDGAVVVTGNGAVEGEGFTFTLEGHPEGRVTRVYFR